MQLQGPHCERCYYCKNWDCLSINNSHITLKRTHSFYYQVKMAMFCTKTKWCSFFIRTTIDYYCEWVQFEESICSSILPTLRWFYVLAILPKLTLNVKPIWEPKDWVLEKIFLQKMSNVVNWGNECIDKLLHTTIVSVYINAVITFIII